jgi:pimeloyl-ACP methyl ester carboxylesterase
MWDRVASHLSGVPLFIPSLPGRLGVEWPDDEKDRDVAAYGRYVLSQLDAHGIDAATIAGHSLGGAIAIWLALEHPGRVTGLGLCCTGARLRVWPHVLENLGDGVRDALDFFVNAQCGPATTDRDRVVLHRIAETTGVEQTLEDLRACDAFDEMLRVERIRVPVQVLAGEEDLCTPVKYATYLAARLPASRLTIYPRVGHALPLERAEEVAGELAVLWASSSPRGKKTQVSEVREAQIVASGGESPDRPAG